MESWLIQMEAAGVQCADAICSGKVRLEELHMLLDGFLTYCRLILKFANTSVEALRRVVSVVSSLLYAAIGSGNRAISATDLNATLTLRMNQIIELCPIEEATSCVALWQCYLKILAGNNFLPDDARLKVLVQLLGIAAAVPPEERTKWLQFVRLALKLNKHSLLRVKLPESGVLSALALLKDLLPNDPLVKELLVLPVVPFVVPTDKDLFRALQSHIPEELTEKEGTLSSFLIQLGEDPLTKTPWGAIFTPSIRTNFPNWPPLDANRGESWLLASFSQLKLANYRHRDAFLDDLIVLIAISPFVPNHAISLALASCLLRDILRPFKTIPIMSSNSSSSSSSSNSHSLSLQKLVITAHLPRSLLGKTTFKEILAVYQAVSTRRGFGNWWYWPLAAMRNCIKEIPTPSDCAILFEICAQQIVLKDTALRPVAEGALIDCWGYLESHHMHQMLSLLPLTSMWFKSRILLKLASTPSISELILMPLLGSLVQEETTHSSLIRLEVLRSLELFFKFYQEVDKLEPWLEQNATLQGEVIGFLRRQGIKQSNPSPEWIDRIGDELRKSMDMNSVYSSLAKLAPLGSTCIQSTSMAIDDHEMEKVLRDLEHLFENQDPSLLTIRVGRLRQWMNTRKLL